MYQLKFPLSVLTARRQGFHLVAPDSLLPILDCLHVEPGQTRIEQLGRLGKFEFHRVKNFILANSLSHT